MTKIIFAVASPLEGVQFKSFISAVAHGVADVIGPHGFHRVEVTFQVRRRPLEKVVVVAGAQQEYRLASVLPVSRVLRIGFYAVVLEVLTATRG
ncbi:MAG: hypothetical protein ACYTEK_12300 [Planctomycetota bacterium]